MRVTITGATGLIGKAIAVKLLARGDEVTALVRNPDKARRAIPGVTAAVRWEPDSGEIAPPEALSGADGVIHLTGESIAQRWTDEAKKRIEDSRIQSTRFLVDGLKESQPRPAVFVCASGISYYGAHGDEKLDESHPAGSDFLAVLSVEWEKAAEAATDLGVRVVHMRTGVALDVQDSALQKMLPPFRLGVGGPVAGGGQYMSWIHLADLVDLYIAALDSDAYRGPINATAPNPVTNKEFSHALGKVLHRPAFMPVPGFVLRARFGEMSSVITAGQRVVPTKALELGFNFKFTDAESALRDVLSRPPSS